MNINTIFLTNQILSILFMKSWDIMSNRQQKCERENGGQGALVYFAYCFLLFNFIAMMLSCNPRSNDVIAENEYYVCSMDPQVMEKQPGNCPICKMPLTKSIYNKSQTHSIKLSQEQIRLGG